LKKISYIDDYCTVFEIIFLALLLEHISISLLIIAYSVDIAS